MNNCIVNRSKAKARQYFVDNLSAILITYMIFVVHLTYFCHINGFVFEVADCLFYFFMSWFFFKSGMFYKEKPVKDVLKSTFRRLIVPYITFNIVGIVVLALEEYQSERALSITSLTKEVLVTIFINEAVYPSLALWFLLSLFIVRNAFNILRRLNINIFVVLIAALACLFTIYYLCYYRWAGYDNIPYTFAWGEHLSKNILLLVGNICCGMVMYCLGYLLKDIKYTKYVVITSAIVYLIHLFFPIYIDFRIIDSDNLALAILFSLSGIILYDFIFKRHLNKRIPVLTYIGRNSMTYYVTHYVIMSALFNLVYKNFTMDKTTLYVVSFFTIIVLLFVADRIFSIRWLKWMIGK